MIPIQQNYDEKSLTFIAFNLTLIECNILGILKGKFALALINALRYSEIKKLIGTDQEEELKKGLEFLKRIGLIVKINKKYTITKDGSFAYKLVSESRNKIKSDNEITLINGSDVNEK